MLFHPRVSRELRPNTVPKPPPEPDLPPPVEDPMPPEPPIEDPAPDPTVPVVAKLRGVALGGMELGSV